MRPEMDINAIKDIPSFQDEDFPAFAETIYSLFLHQSYLDRGANPRVTPAVLKTIIETYLVEDVADPAVFNDKVAEATASLQRVVDASIVVAMSMVDLYVPDELTVKVADAVSIFGAIAGDPTSMRYKRIIEIARGAMNAHHDVETNLELPQSNSWVAPKGVIVHNVLGKKGHNTRKNNLFKAPKGIRGKFGNRARNTLRRTLPRPNFTRKNLIPIIQPGGYRKRTRKNRRANRTRRR
jgi:hypothetical protein